MDSARDFDLLGESVPQVGVSAHTLALLGFFQLFIYSDSLLSEKKIHVYISLERQLYVPRLEPTAPIRLADGNHTHYLSRHCTILIKALKLYIIKYIIMAI